MLKAGDGADEIIERITQQAVRRAKRPAPERCREYAEQTVIRAGTPGIRRRQIAQWGDFSGGVLSDN